MTRQPRTIKNQEEAQAPRMSQEELIKAVSELPEGDAQVLQGFLGGDANSPLGFEDDVYDTSRDPRHSDRDLESREKTGREPMTWLPRSALPDPLPAPGWNYRWIRVSYTNANSEDHSNVQGRLREGWVVVKPEEQPHIAATLPRGGQGQDRIVIGNDMLVKIPSEIVRQRREYYARQNRSQISGVQSQMLNMQDARMPILRPHIQTTTSKKVAD